VYAGAVLNFYISGFKHQYLALAKNQCISSEEPGVYTTTLMLRKDGELVNYVYDAQNDVTYMAFASNSSGRGIEYALFYLDAHSIFNSVMLELLDPYYKTIQTIKPTPTKYTNQVMKGTIELGNIMHLASVAIQGLATYDNSSSQQYQYSFTPKPVKSVEIFFDGHTLETRDAHYQLTILDSKNHSTSPMVYSCNLPLADSDCFGKVKRLTPSHYVVYLEESNNIEIAKFSHIDSTKRAIYSNGDNGIYFSWDDSEGYSIDLNTHYPKAFRSIFSWVPFTNKYSSALHLLSWEDHPSLPSESYQNSCDMNSMVFESGILNGVCNYTDNFGKTHKIISTLNYDQLCKDDPLQNDMVVNINGYLSCH
jgi:hypothetical protein